MGDTYVVKELVLDDYNKKAEELTKIAIEKMRVAAAAETKVLYEKMLAEAKGKPLDIEIDMKVINAEVDQPVYDGKWYAAWAVEQDKRAVEEA